MIKIYTLIFRYEPGWQHFYVSLMTNVNYIFYVTNQRYTACLLRILKYTHEKNLRYFLRCTGNFFSVYLFTYCSNFRTN